MESCIRDLCKRHEKSHEQQLNAVPEHEASFDVAQS